MAIATRLLDEGYTVVLHYCTSKTNVVKLAAKYPGKAFVVQADLEKPADIKRMAQEVMAVAGHVDILLNNAGIASAGISWKIPLNEWDKVMRLNLTAPMLVSQQFIPAMRANGWGRIIFFSSIVAQTGITGTAAYAAAKSGLFGLCRAMAKDVAPSGITVNCIAPGYMDTGMIREIPDTMRSEVKAATPLGTLGNPAAITETVLYLAAENSTFITGEIISVNGGLYMSS
jgi:NAD(P)-dependent dehydrogenase (short-subunit alcohol dehydrogenase family)